MTCERFRSQFTPGTEDPAVVDHLRSCDACLNFAVEKDGDALFRSIGGAEMIPPGGVDAFVDEVMRSVRVRGKEETVVSALLRWPRRLAAAAAIAIAFAGASLVYVERTGRMSMPPVAHHQFTTAKPVIESYDSQQATIIEVPTDGENLTVVMIFDDTLPADL